MNALLILYAGALSPQAYEPLINGKNSISVTLERARSFPNVAKTVVFGPDSPSLNADLLKCFPADVHFSGRALWSARDLLEAIAAFQEGYDLTYFAWLDCPFLDPALAGRLADRHLKYIAEYSYADGWPYGLAPELLAPSTAPLLANILKDDDTPVERDALFQAIQKDINSFDIETEISSVDLRCHRLNFCADSKRNMLLLRRFISEGSERREAGVDAIPDTATVERIIAESPEVLRTLPNFFPIQVYSGCPQSCALCPYPQITPAPVTEMKDYMDAAQFKILLDKITAFCSDAVIDLSLWGELSMHPQKMKIAELVMERPSLALIIETSGIGWKTGELESLAECARTAAANPSRINPLPPVSWIVSLDTRDAARYRELRGPGFTEAAECAKKIMTLFPKNAYVQAVRTSGAEDDVEKFYRSYSEISDTRNIIIQKYDDFCGFLKRLQASDISPVNRQPCWHIMRDMPVLIDGTVPRCRENMGVLKAVMTHNDITGDDIMGNVFVDSLENIWVKGYEFYKQQCGKKYSGNCAECDEYYTYNF
ncbi:MAG: spiro-SPASM protein [Treponema sp.]|nr:spiro-SPASM protein [Treponema sp.]